MGLRAQPNVTTTGDESPQGKGVCGGNVVPPPRSVLLQNPQRLELRLEQCLVDLALVDGHAFLDADADDLLAVDPQFLRQLLGREVVRHRRSSPCTKKPACATALSGLARTSRFWCRIQRAGPPNSFILPKDNRRS